jgi:hypothetical protein
MLNSRRGFVYMLANVAMPCYYKIGSTTKLPQRRAAELSSASGVPDRFHIVCYVEVEDCRDAEQHLHQFLGDFRPNFDREFFMFRDEDLAWVIGLFQFHPQQISFVRRQSPYDIPTAVEAVNPWTADGGGPELRGFGPIAFLNVEPV